MKKNRFCILALLLSLVVSPFSVHAQEYDESDETRTLAPYFYVEGADAQTDSFPLKETRVDTTINGVIAETYVTQTYTNEGKQPINASYMFPASTKVAVQGMKMEIGNEVIVAKIKEKEEAKVEFEEAKSEGKSASLLQQQRPNVFTMDVANVMPGDVVRIELHYTEMISPTEGIYQFVFPTVAGPRYVSPSDETDAEDDEWVQGPYFKEGSANTGAYDISVNLSTGVPITEISCRSHDISINQDTDSTAQVRLSNPSDFAGDRDFILDYKLTDQEVSCGLILNQGAEENFFMLMVQPPERYETADIPPREYIFVLDVSGSMFGYPLDTAKELIQNLVKGLRETDFFNLILFSSSSARLSPKSLPATAENIQLAIDLIDQEDGGGGTELAPALKDAIDIPMAENVSRSIIPITDGYIYGESEIFELVRSNLSTTSFFSFGIGTSVNRYLIDGIAKAGQGESFVVTDEADAAETAARFCTYIQSPLLTDIKVAYDGFEVYDTQPSALPTLFAQRPVVLFGKWRGEPEGTIKVTGKSGSREYTEEIPVSGAPVEGNTALQYLWARTKVELLTDYGFNETDENAARAEVTQIGLKYSMLTPYTSFIAVTETIRNETGDSTDVDQPLPLPSHVSELAIGNYTVGSEPDMILLIFAVLLMLSICSLTGRRKRQAAASQGAGHEKR